MATTSTTSVPLEDLFVSRFSTGWLLMVVYFPLGVLLLVVRLFMGLQLLLAVCLLPHDTLIRSAVLRVMFFVMGMVVREEDKHKVKKHSVFVANHLSPFDHFAVKVSSDCTSMSSADCGWPLDSAFGCDRHGVRSGDLGSFLRSNPQRSALVFPEGRPTSGRRGLLKFDVLAFSTGFPVQPVLIRAWRPPMLSPSLSTRSSHPFVDLLFFLFVPVTVYNLRYLDVIPPNSEETYEDLSGRVQTLMASELEVQATSYTHRDIDELKKKQTRRPNTAVRSMADRVKEVLPSVPVDTIIKDLKRTKDVEQTISNLLEGNITYTPEDAPKENIAPSLNTSASKFGRSANERMASFQERKEKLIENARKRYLEKHPTNS